MALESHSQSEEKILGCVDSMEDNSMHSALYVFVEKGQGVLAHKLLPQEIC